ncbi:MAG: D-alanyl-D-alanine carboxypeptidase/D-alanyl-D-alanine-endopeptidase [Paracoccaceae bacterium]
MADRHASSAVTRRVAVAGLLAALPGASLAASPLAMPPPRRRPHVFEVPEPPVPGSLADVVSKNDVDGHTGAVLVDFSSGGTVEAFQPDLKLPPASTAKALTTLYALETLGADFRFRTRVVITGPVTHGRVQGDLYLVGGGDPHLDTDHLAEMVDQLVARGIFGVSGSFFVCSNALPLQRRIDPAQPEYVGYNPSVSGLNLNFNRVFFEWERKKDGYRTVLEARSRHHRPAVKGVELTLADRASPVFAYRSVEGHDAWSVARGMLGRKGGRWLPVREPGDYVGEVFRTLAAARNVRLPAHRAATVVPRGETAAEYTSIELSRVLKSMLHFSTNMTAEAVGMASSAARGASFDTLAGSAAAMSDWAAANTPLSEAQLVDHSGLSDRSRIAPQDMVGALRSPRGADTLRELAKSYAVPASRGRSGSGGAIRVHAKSGTLNFTRCLTGIIENGAGRVFGFAVFTCNFQDRERYAGLERPPGSRRWRNRAQRQERALLRRWAGIAAG